MGAEFDWSKLLLSIRRGKVVPVVGRDLLRVQHGDREVLLDRLIAEQFCMAVGLKIEDFAPDAGLNTVVRSFLQSSVLNGTRRESVETIHDIWKKLQVRLPLALEQLAEITDFNLFVSTTTDSLLSRAINNARFGGASGVRAVSYSLRKPAHDVSLGQDDPPVVFQLFGAVSNVVDDYVVTDKDLLEFMYRLQSGWSPLPNILDKLRDDDLLLIGCDLADWLARFFLRNFSRHPFGEDIERRQLVVPMPSDPNLVVFLRDNKMEVASEDARAFVGQLYERWKQGGGGSPNPALASPPIPPSDLRYVFLSYASEDINHAVTIKQLLEAEQCVVWFDRRDMRPSDNIRQRIELCIRRSSAFIPCISKSTLQRHKRNDLDYLYFEWNKAIESLSFRHPSTKYLHPLVVDDTAPYSEEIPDAFRRLSIPRFVEGRLPDGFLEEIRKTLGLGPEEGRASA